MLQFGYTRLNNQPAAAACNVSTLPKKMELETETWTFNGWKYAHYFKLIRSKDDKNINVKCKLCPGGTKTLSTTKNTTSNLLKHLQRQHNTVKLVEIDPSKGEPCAADCTPMLNETGRTGFFGYNKPAVLYICRHLIWIQRL